MNFNGILSIIVAFAMLFSGAYDAEQPEALSARTLTLSDVVIVYENQPIELSPSLSLGMMTQENGAVLDFHMDCGEEKLFPVQLAIDDEKASLALIKGGKSFSISNETLEKILKDQGVDVDAILNFDMETALDKLYQELLADMDEDAKEIFNQLLLDLLPTTIDMYTYLMDPENQAQYQADMEKVNQEIRALGGEPTQNTITYADTAYDVNTYKYSLDFDQIMEMVDKVYTANVKTAEFYQSYFNFINLIIAQQNKAIEEINRALLEDYEAAVAAAEAKAAAPAAATPEPVPANEGTISGTNSSLSVLRPVSAAISTAEPAPAPTAMPTPIPEPELMPTVAPVESFRDIFAMADMEDLEMRMDCTESLSEDGQFAVSEVVMSISFPGMEEPFVYDIFALKAGEETVLSMTTSVEQDGVYVDMKIGALQTGQDATISMTVSSGELEEDEAVDETTGESEIIVTEEELMAMNFVLEKVFDPEANENHYFCSLAADSEGAQVIFQVEGIADEAGNASNNVFAAAVEDGVESSVQFNLGVSAEPFENLVPAMEETEFTPELIDILTGKTAIEEIPAIADASSIGIIGGADGPTSVYVTDPSAESIPEPTLSPEAQAMEDLQTAVESAFAPFGSDLAILTNDEGVSDLVSLAIFGYIPEDEAEIDEDEEDEYEDDNEASSYMSPEAAAPDSDIDPQFTYIPEGFILEDSEIDTEFGSYDYEFVRESEYASFSVSIYTNEYNNPYTYYSVSPDGVPTLIEDSVITLEPGYSEDSFYIVQDKGYMTIMISVYDGDITFEEGCRILAGMTY